MRYSDVALRPTVLDDGSLDATLASAGLPIIALDLRKQPNQPAVNDWLKAAHQTRSIGALFSNEQAADYFVSAAAPDMFNVLLFIEKTTAARPIAPSGAN